MNPSGVFYNKEGVPFTPAAISPLVKVTARNEGGWMLNAYGERGNRSIWLTYTRSKARQLY